MRTGRLYSPASKTSLSLQRSCTPEALTLSGTSETGAPGANVQRNVAGFDSRTFVSAHTGAATREFVSLAGRHGLFVTAGVDFHGPGSERDKMSGFEYSAEYFSEIRKVFL